MANPIKDIFDELETLINNEMTIANGYQYDWGDVIYWDEAKQDNLPASYMQLVEEENSDYQNLGGEVNSEINTIKFEITIFAKLGTSLPTRPIKEITDLLTDLLVDFKRLINRNNTINQTCEDFMYVSSKPFYPKANDAMQPGQLKVMCRCLYQQERQEPKNRR